MEIGQKVKDIRLQQGLTQEDLADRCGLTKGFISQLENDLTSPSIQSLVDILTALGTTLESFFSGKKREQVVFTKEDVFVKEDDEVGLNISWLVPNAKKNEMEPILIELKQGAETMEYSPIDAELFGYVLEGVIHVTVGDKTYTVHQEESFYLIKPSTYKIEALKNTKLLWVSTPPIF